jgi:hypothetical protein
VLRQQRVVDPGLEVRDHLLNALARRKVLAEYPRHFRHTMGQLRVDVRANTEGKQQRVEGGGKGLAPTRAF